MMLGSEGLLPPTGTYELLRCKATPATLQTFEIRRYHSTVKHLGKEGDEGLIKLPQAHLLLVVFLFHMIIVSM